MKMSKYKSISTQLHLMNEDVTNHPLLKMLNESKVSLNEQEKSLMVEFYSVLGENDFRELNKIISEGWLDRLKAKGSGASSILKNFGTYMKGFDSKDQLKDPTKAKLNSILNSFRKSFGKELSDLSTDLSKLNLGNIDNIQSKAKDLGIEKKPNPLIPWVIKVLKKIEDKAANSPVVQNYRSIINNLVIDIGSKFSDDGIIKKSVRELGDYAKKNPKKVNVVIGALVAVSKMSGIPGSGIAAGLILRTAIGVAKGEEPAKAVYSAAKITGVGYLAGSALKGTLGFLGSGGSENAVNVGLDAADGDISDIPGLEDAIKRLDVAESEYFEARRTFPKNLNISWKNGIPSSDGKPVNLEFIKRYKDLVIKTIEYDDARLAAGKIPAANVTLLNNMQVRQFNQLTLIDKYLNAGNSGVGGQGSGVGRGKGIAGGVFENGEHLNPGTWGRMSKFGRTIDEKITDRLKAKVAGLGSAIKGKDPTKAKQNSLLSSKVKKLKNLYDELIKDLESVGGKPRKDIESKYPDIKTFLDGVQKDLIEKIKIVKNVTKTSDVSVSDENELSKETDSEEK